MPLPCEPIENLVLKKYITIFFLIIYFLLTTSKRRLVFCLPQVKEVDLIKIVKVINNIETQYS